MLQMEKEILCISPSLAKTLCCVLVCFIDGLRLQPGSVTLQSFFHFVTLDLLSRALL